MRVVIIKSFLKAMSAFLIVYFMTIGIQYLAWKNADKWDDLRNFTDQYTFPPNDLIDLPFTPILWPLAGHWYIYR